MQHDHYEHNYFQSRGLAIRTVRSSSSSSCSISASSCGAGQCLLNCQCASAEDCQQAGIVIGAIIGGIVGFILLVFIVGCVLVRMGKLKRVGRVYYWHTSSKVKAFLEQQATTTNNTQSRDQRDISLTSYPTNRDPNATNMMYPQQQQGMNMYQGAPQQGYPAGFNPYAQQPNYNYNGTTYNQGAFNPTAQSGTGQEQQTY